MTILRWRVASTLFIALLAALPSLAAAQRKEKIRWVSFGDYLEEGKDFSSSAAIEKSFRRLQDAGYTTIYWRTLWAVPGDLEWYTYRLQLQMAQARKEFENTPYPWDPHEMRWPIEVAHRLGMKFYAQIEPYNMGAPPGAYAELGIEPQVVAFPTGPVYETQFPYAWKFLRKNPQYQLVDRTGQHYHYGVMEYAYPEARRHWTDRVGDLLDKYDVDGLYIDTRTECMSPQYADQYGFNGPIVKEYQKRYGVNILEEDFDVEKWRALRGEYFTLFLQEMSQLVRAKGKPLSLGTSRGDYIGFPLGNMKLEWRKWISEKIIDELHLDEHGWAWGKQGYGYVTDFATERGLKPLEAAVREDYGPLCRQKGVKLYFACRPYRSRPVSDQCCHGRATLVGVKHPADWCKTMAAMAEFDGTIE